MRYLLGLAVWMLLSITAAPAAPRYAVVVVYDGGVAQQMVVVSRVRQAFAKELLDMHVTEDEFPLELLDARKVAQQVVHLAIQLDHLPVVAGCSLQKDGKTPDRVLRMADRVDNVMGAEPALIFVTADLFRKLGHTIPMLGVRAAALTPPVLKMYPTTRTQGVVIYQLTPDTPAAGCGIAVGDVLIQLDGVALNNPQQMQTIIRSHKVGDKVILQYDHQGKTHMVSVKLAQAR